MTAHPLADLFPPMGDDEYAALRDDIAAHGQLEPIVRSYVFVDAVAELLDARSGR